MNEFMERAVALAKISASEGEVPVGAVVVKDNEIVGEGRNRRELGKNALYHAETEAINNACKNLGGWRLWQCEMFVTLEPCPMCAGAILQSRISKIHIGTFDETTGAAGSTINILQNPNLNHFLDIVWNNDEECSKILTEFFKDRRG